MGHESISFFGENKETLFQGTYGGHLELSAFAHFARRNVKVIQPGLVYVIEWNAGGDEVNVTPSVAEVDGPVARENRRLRRQLKREEKMQKEVCEELISKREETLQEEFPEDTVYVAYVAFVYHQACANACLDITIGNTFHQSGT